MKLIRFLSQWQLQVRGGGAPAGKGVPGGGGMGTQCSRAARLLHVRVPGGTCTRACDIHGGTVVQAPDADPGIAALRSNPGSHGRRVSHPLASLSSEYTVPV